jgi:hypothetical protein
VGACSNDCAATGASNSEPCANGFHPSASRCASDTDVFQYGGTDPRTSGHDDNIYSYATDASMHEHGATALGNSDTAF